MEFIYYRDADEKKWDEFVESKSMNGTFLQTRRFLNYHPKERFKDCSLFIYDEKKRLVAVCPACDTFVDEKRTFFSHMGSTFGGIVIDKKFYRTEMIIRILEELKSFLKEQGFLQIYLKMTSDIFSIENGDLFQYAFYYEGFKQYVELSTYVDFKNYKEDILSNFSQGKRRNI
ncbi:MAG: GNAT family N-acetyltransferase, partial [Eubacteriales bacterium]|nr:GNAT family N-acetyltransferase [Eubacteriales bacterium]